MLLESVDFYWLIAIHNLSAIDVHRSMNNPKKYWDLFLLFCFFFLRGLSILIEKNKSPHTWRCTATNRRWTCTKRIDTSTTTGACTLSEENTPNKFSVSFLITFGRFSDCLFSLPVCRLCRRCCCCCYCYSDYYYLLFLFIFTVCVTVHAVGSHRRLRCIRAGWFEPITYYYFKWFSVV